MDLITGSQAGDQLAFAALFDQYKNLVYRTAYLMLGSEADAEDALQEVFVQVYRALASYDPAKAAFTTWLHRITVNHCLNRQRKRRPLSLTPADLDGRDGHGLSPERSVEQDETIRAALAHLSDKLQAVVVLRYAWDLTYAEIGLVLDIPAGTVKSRLSAALTTMRRTLGADREPVRTGEVTE
jgi:RNA polymerase sigma-70 factor (ECF subfamily)